MCYLAVGGGGRLNMNMWSYSIGITMKKIKWSDDRLVFNMGIPILEEDCLYIETGPRDLPHYGL